MKALKPFPEPRKALETVREMARYGKEKEALLGIQVINEPHMFTQDEHWFLKGAIIMDLFGVKLARRFMAPCATMSYVMAPAGYPYTSPMRSWLMSALI